MAMFVLVLVRVGYWLVLVPDAVAVEVLVSVLAFLVVLVVLVVTSLICLC